MVEANNLQKEFKTIYDMVMHLSGRPIPGIPINSSLPKDEVERAKQVHWQHQTLLTFLKSVILPITLNVLFNVHSIAHVHFSELKAPASHQ